MDPEEDQSRETAKPDGTVGGGAGESRLGAGATAPAPDVTGITGSAWADDARTDQGPRQLAAQEQAVIAQLPLDSAVLVDQAPGNEPGHYLLDTDVITVGRHPDSDIYLDDISVSRRHLEFHRTDGNFHAHDVGSLNGTFVNRDRVDDVELRHGDEVGVGKFRLVFYPGNRPQ